MATAAQALQVGYCTNVHAGADLPQTRANLERYALAVKRLASPQCPMGIGLWLSASAADRLIKDNQTDAFADWLREVGLLPFTLNGFPYGDFHSRVVKHQVYLPTWYEPARYEYTRKLVHILDQLLPAGLEGSISTLPIAWGKPDLTPAQKQATAHYLHRIAADLADLEARTGRLIYLCLEPEPGCVLQLSTDVVRFFEQVLLPGQDESRIRRYLRICHDVCHQVVMFEEQEEVLARYRAAGIRVGKIQVSSAVCVPFAETAQSCAALSQLAAFVEERYLHQTVCRTRPGERAVFYEDLPLALNAVENRPPAGEWRTHFHVPIYLERFGHLYASQTAILECVKSALAHKDTQHFEVETYAWGVLPEELQQSDLATGIAREMTWFQARTFLE